MSNIVNIVMEVVAQVGLLISLAALYVFLVACVFPRIFLRPGYDTSVIHDRGLKKYVFPNGRAIVYEPSRFAAKYIKQYILSSNHGEKYIKCKLDKRINSIRFDVIAMDSADRVIEIIQVDDPVMLDGMTRGALLPSNTSYVSVIVKEVNSRIVEAEKQLSLPLGKAVIYVVLSVICSVAVGLAGNALIDRWFEMALYDYASAGLAGYLRQALICGIAGLIVSAVITLFHLSKEVKIRK